jgi:hypothetical protein
MMKQFITSSLIVTTTWISYWTAARSLSLSFTPIVSSSSRVLNAALRDQQQPFVRKHHLIFYAAPTTEAELLTSNTTTDETVVVESSSTSRGGFARVTGAPRQPYYDEEQNVTNVLDYALSVILSDVGSILLGSLGLLVCVVNHILASNSDDNVAIMGQQSRTDLLATFSSIALLLNGVSKLDVTSALAETVILEGIKEEKIQYTDVGERWLLRGQDFTTSTSSKEDASTKSKTRFQWALQSILTSSPAETAVIMIYDKDISTWRPGVFTGIVPKSLSQLQKDNHTMLMRSNTPILDRFLTVGPTKESYLPTLQALPGKVEFLTYLPTNTQAVLILPLTTNTNTIDEDKENRTAADPAAVLVLGSSTAKIFTPRDIAWLQVVASRLDTFREDNLIIKD